MLRFNLLFLPVLLASPVLGQEQPTNPAPPVKKPKPAVPTGPVKVTVDPNSNLGTVDPRFFGLNEAFYDGNFNRPETPGVFKDLAPSMLRWPGGSQSDSNDWTVDRPLKSPTSMYKVTTKNFIEAIEGQNIRVIITTNYGTGSPEMAAAWVAWANGSPADKRPLGKDEAGRDWLTVGHWASLRAAKPLAEEDGQNHLRLGRAAPLGWKDWEIGNEIYGNWEKDLFSKHDGYDYATRAVRYLSQMRAVDPAARLYAVANDTIDAPRYETASKHPVTDPNTGATHDAFTPVMLARFKELGVYPDGIAYHRYAIAPKGESVFAVSSAWPKVVAGLRQTINNYAGENGAKMEILVTETNYGSPWPNKVTVNLQSALLMADTFGIGMTTELKTLMWWQRQADAVEKRDPAPQFQGWRADYTSYNLMTGPNSNVSGMPKRIFLPNQKFPTYFGFKMMQYFARGGETVLKVNSDDTGRLSVYAVKAKDGSLRLMAINKSWDKPQQVTLDMGAYKAAGTAATYSYGKAQDENAKLNMEDQGTRSEDVTTGTVSLVGNPASLTVEPSTILIVQMKPGG